MSFGARSKGQPPVKLSPSLLAGKSSVSSPPPPPVPVNYDKKLERYKKALNDILDVVDRNTGRGRGNPALYEIRDLATAVIMRE